jgi:hypothetical protein
MRDQYFSSSLQCLDVEEEEISVEYEELVDNIPMPYQTASWIDKQHQYYCKIHYYQDD